MADRGATIRVLPDDRGMRVDRFARRILRSATLGEVYRWIRTGRIRVGGKRVSPGTRLEAGDEVCFDVPREAFAGRTPGRESTGPLDVLYEDEDLVFVAKPAGLAVHPGTGQRNDLLGIVLARYSHRVRPGFAPAPAHRIDKGTSGVVAFGLSSLGLRDFQSQLREGMVGKFYLAVVAGVPVRNRGRFEGPTGHPERRRKAAVTEYRVLGAHRKAALLVLRPVTGRTHQIRQHLAAAGHPILGDRRYRGPPLPPEFGGPPGRFLLHLATLRCLRPRDRAALEVCAALPEDLRRALAAFGWGRVDPAQLPSLFGDRGAGPA